MTNVYSTWTIKIEKSADVALGTRTQGLRMVGAFDSNELWRPKLFNFKKCLMQLWPFGKFYLQPSPTCVSWNVHTSFNDHLLTTIDTVNQGNWSLSIKLRLECFVIVAWCQGSNLFKKRQQSTRLLALPIINQLKCCFVLFLLISPTSISNPFLQKSSPYQKAKFSELCWSIFIIFCTRRQKQNLPLMKYSTYNNNRIFCKNLDDRSSISLKQSSWLKIA